MTDQISGALTDTLAISGTLSGVQEISGTLSAEQSIAGRLAYMTVATLPMTLGATVLYNGGNI